MPMPLNISIFAQTLRIRASMNLVIFRLEVSILLLFLLKIAIAQRPSRFCRGLVVTSCSKNRLMVSMAVRSAEMLWLKVGRAGAGKTAAQELASVKISNIQLKYDASPLLMHRKTNKGLDLTVSWNASVPADGRIDGFLIRAFDLLSNVPLTLKSPCSAGLSHVWIKGPGCPSTAQMPLCYNETVSPPTGDSCLCRAENCSLFTWISQCRGVAYWLTQNPEYVAVEQTLRSVIFAADFHRSYQFNIIPYYRQATSFATGTATTLANYNCPAVIAASTNLNYSQALAQCCDLNITHHHPLNLRVATAANLTSGTLNAILTWLPPLFQRNLKWQVRVHVKGSPLLENMPIVGMVESYIPSDVPEDLIFSCYNSSVGYQAVVGNIQIGYTYVFSVTRESDLTTVMQFCPSNICSEIIEVNYPNVSICDPMFKACDSGSYCRMDRNRTYCVPMTTTVTSSYCDLRGSLCVDRATCVNQVSTIGTPHCVCPNGFTGDGLKNGTGCNAGDAPLQSIFTILLLLIVSLAIIFYQTCPPSI